MWGSEFAILLTISVVYSWAVESGCDLVAIDSTTARDRIALVLLDAHLEDFHFGACKS